MFRGSGNGIHSRVFRLVVIYTIFWWLMIAIMPLQNVRASEEEDKIFSVEEIKLLAAAMELENGCNSDLCILLTGSVILNRVAHPRYPNTIKGVLLQKGQYAKHTVDNLYRVKVSDRVMSLALKLATHRPLDPEIIFQSQYKHLGHIKYIVDKEYFATE